MNYQTSSVPKISYQSPQAPTQSMTKTPLADSGFVVPVFSLIYDPIACLNKAMAFLIAVASSRGDKGKVILVLVIRVMLQALGETMQVGRTAEEIIARERERKARTTLLMALLEDHLAKFHKMTDAKEMWDAIKSRFGGNDESKRRCKSIS
ncbi:hypothetical protein Tco_0425741 [Tanacetum coccineum]